MDIFVLTHFLLTSCFVSLSLLEEAACCKLCRPDVIQSTTDAINGINRTRKCAFSNSALCTLDHQYNRRIDRRSALQPSFGPLPLCVLTGAPCSAVCARLAACLCLAVGGITGRY